MAHCTTEQRLVSLAEDGSLSFEQIARACLTFMSNSDVEEMARCEELIVDIDEPDEVEYQVSLVLDNGGERFLETFDNDMRDGEYQADQYAEAYATDNHCMVIVEQVTTDPSGFVIDRTEVTRFEH